MSGAGRISMRILSCILIILGIYLLAHAGYDELRGVTRLPVIFQLARTPGTYSYYGSFDRGYPYSIPVHREQNPERFTQFMAGHWICAVVIEFIGCVLYFRSKQQTDP